MLASRLRMAASAIAGVTYLLLDKFTSPLSAGSVNGTNAEPGPGTRLVTDTGNKLAIVGGEIQVTGYTGTRDPQLHFTESTARTGGYTYINRLNLPSGTNRVRFGLGSGAIEPRRESFYYDSTVLRVHENNANVFENRIITASLPKELTYAVVILPTQGALFFVRGGIFTTWAFLYPGVTDTTATLYSGVSPQTAGATAWDVLYHGVADLSENAELNTLYGLANSRQSGSDRIQ